MRITIIGTGYVGLVTGACFAEMGNTVMCVDKDAAKIAALVDGKIPFYEPGLAELVSTNQQSGRLYFTSSLQDAVADSPVQFIAVGTPPGEDGSADLTHVLDVAHIIGRNLRADCIVVDKSTVPIGTAERVQAVIDEELSRRGVKHHVEVVSNPEFLKEGSAVNDFMRPDRVIVGSDSTHATDILRALYAPFIRNHERMLVMGVRDAEMTKYAANAMLATRISFMNEMAGICDRVGVDVENVRRGIGSDSRIGYSFIYPGCGYGGSCFPKDIKALTHMAENAGVAPHLLKAVEARNNLQKRTLFEKMKTRFGNSIGEKTIGIWGLAFKPGTDDVREAPSLVLIEDLLAIGATIKTFDPVASQKARHALEADAVDCRRVEFCASQYDVLAGADALVLVTEWKPFRNADFVKMRGLMRTPTIFDGRNQYDPQQVRDAGFEYFGIGR
jgi:UDPglucose 6-dehydrogenase